MSVKQFKINYRRHPGQFEVLTGILKSDADIIVVDASRGWGKTLFATCDLVIPKLLSIPGCQVMWVAPTYKIGKAPIDDVWFGYDEHTGLRYVPQFDEATGFQFWDFKKGDMEVHVFNESRLYIRSADSPNSIVAKGYNLIIIDEAAIIDRDVFMQHILPTARRSGCKIMLISTPRGRNWFYEIYLAGQDLSRTEYISFMQPWWKRPNYPEVLKRLMKDMPTHMREQEFEAQFIADGSGAFKNLSKIFKGQAIQLPDIPQKWEATLTSESFNSDNYVVAVDFAKSADYTVIIVMSIEQRKCVYYERMNKTDYKVVLERIKRVSKAYNGADLIYDSTGVGAGLGDFLSSSLHSMPYNFTNETKKELVNRLIVACEYAEIELPNIVTMREEFELFTYSLTKTGKLSYSAPSGKHDDTVIAVALANWYCTESSGKTQVEEVESFLDLMNEIQRPRSRLDELMDED